MKEDLRELAKLYDQKSLNETVAYIREKPEALEQIVTDSYLPTDPTRQLFRRAMRYAVDTPNIEWQDVFNENKP